MASHEQAGKPVSRPDFWESSYQAGRAGWDLGQPAPWFQDLLDADERPAPGRVAVLGCGKGHDALLFAERGFDVTGFDFAPSAVEAARSAAAAANLSATFVQSDIFALPATYRDTFGYVVEHACFSAIDPERRSEYVDVVATLLRPGGTLFGLFFVHDRLGGPPFATNADELRRLFAGRFTIESLAPPPRSVERRRGAELAGRFRRT
jgi:SAM-dependent methyltransferase